MSKKVIFIPQSADAQIPQRHSDGAAGYDIHTVHSGIIEPFSCSVFRTGFTFDVPKGLFPVVFGRSGFALKHGLEVMSHYCESGSEISVWIYNNGSAPFNVEKGMRIAQVVFLETKIPTFKDTSAECIAQSTDCPDMLKRARYFEIAERYQDMSVEMKKVMKKCIDEGLEISSIVRNLFSLSFKNLVCSRRSSWRVLFAERQRLEEKHSEDLYIVDDILSTIKKELIEICDEVLQNIAEYPLVDFGKYNKIHNVFFLKMQGDYSRYKAEALGDDAKEAVDAASESYTKAMDLASDLSSTDPIKLGLLLNYSVFNYEILNNCEKACSIAQNAFNAAISELDTLKEDYYKDSTLIMQLLRDNLTLWTSKRDVNSEKQDEAYGEPS